MLLQRNPEEQTRERVERPLLAERETGFHDEISLSAFDSPWIWLEVHIRYSLLGLARSLLVRPAAVQIALEVEGRDHAEVRRFAASMSTDGFLISPLIESGKDLQSAYAPEGSSSGLPRVRSVRFECAPEECRFFEPRIGIRIRSATPPASAAR